MVPQRQHRPSIPSPRICQSPRLSPSILILASLCPCTSILTIPTWPHASLLTLGLPSLLVGSLYLCVGSAGPPCLPSIPPDPLPMPLRSCTAPPSLHPPLH